MNLPDVYFTCLAIMYPQDAQNKPALLPASPVPLPHCSPPAPLKSAIHVIVLCLGLLLSLPFPTPVQAQSPLDDFVFIGTDTKNTNSVAWGDADGDGDLDLAVGNVGDVNQVYLNNGAGGFSLGWQSSGDTKITNSVAWGDADGDGDLDLAVGNGGDVNQVYLNNGAGSFSLGWQSSGDTKDTTSVAWGDADGDGDLDLAVVNSNDVNQVYLNNGTGGFSLGWQSSGDTKNTTSVAWGDADGDGDLDLALGNRREVNQVYLNNGTGSFSLGWQSSGDTKNTNSVAWGDADGDGDLDLALGNGGDVNQVYLNNGAGSFSLGWQSSGDTNWTNSVAWGDVDGDGDLDLALGNSGFNQVYLNNGTGGFSLGWQSSDDYKDTNSVAWGDADEDGDLDLAVGNVHSFGEVNQMYLNNGTGGFSLGWQSSDDTKNTNSVAWGDADGDGDLDLALGNSGVNQVYLNNGAGSFSLGWQSSGDTKGTKSVAWGDADGDGDLDLALGNSGVNQVYLNNGAGGFSLGWQSSDDTKNTNSVAWGDADGDGDLDLAVGNGGDVNQVYLNNGAGSFSLGWQSSGDTKGTKSVAWGDADGDGDLDLAVVNSNDVNQVYLNNGTGGFSLGWQSSGDTKYTYSVAWGDADGDGDLDLALGNRYEVNQVYLNDGAGDFSLGWQSSGDNRQTFSVAWGDADGDGDLDLAVGNDDSGFGEVNQVYLNDGAGSFSLGWQSSGDYRQTFSVAWGDADGDGDLDLAAGNADSNQVYENHRQGELGLANNFLSTSSGRPVSSTANFYAHEPILTNHTIPLTYTLFDPEGDPVRFIRAYYSLSGGGQWLPATPTAETITRSLTSNIPIPQPVCSQPNLTITTIRSDTQFVANQAPLVDLNVSISATHTYIGDLSFVLEHVSTGSRVTLIDRPGEPASLYGCAEDDLEVTLDDEATAPVEDECSLTPPAVNGSFSPNSPLNVFDGERFGGSWRLTVADAFPTSDYGTLIEWCLWPTAASPTSHVFIWQVDSDLIKSDNVAFRIEAYQGFTGPGPYQRPYASAATFPFRVQAAEWYAKVVSRTQPISGALVYQAGQLITSTVNHAYRTDRAGLIRLNTPTAGDSLVALKQMQEQPTTRAAHNGWWAYRTYVTSLNLDDQGAPQPDTIGQPGEQVITVRPDDPLILFNIVASIEWDADLAYLQTISRAFQLASGYLYDVTDGQMAFGQVAIYDNAAHWADADFQFSTKNTVRPYAFVGGITSADEAHTIRVGRFWSGDSGNQGRWDQPPGYRTLIHEFGHYALYLHDEYKHLRFENGRFVGEENGACTSPVVRINSSDQTNGSLMYYQYNASELVDSSRWNSNCQQTEQHRRNGEADWQTVRRYYGGSAWQLRTADERPGGVMAGPKPFPSHLLPFPDISINNVGTPGGAARQLTVVNPQGRPVHNALVALYTTPQSYTVAIDQGLTGPTGEIPIYGARNGDTIRAATFDGALAGALAVDDQSSYTMTVASTSLSSLQAQAGSAPYMNLIPDSDGDSVTLRVNELPPNGLPLDAVVLPAEGGGKPQSTILAYSPGNNYYTGQVSFSGVGLGTGRLRISGQALPSAINGDYNLQAVSAITTNHLFSEDGNFELYIPPGGVPASGYATVVPTGYVPGRPPVGKQVIGSAYEVRLSGAVSDLDKTGLVRLHYHPEVMGVYTNTEIYYWDAAAGQWQGQGGEPNEVDQGLAVSTDRLGIYALMGVPLGGTGSDRVYLPLIVK